jgi:hypothetical protein
LPEVSEAGGSPGNATGKKVRSSGSIGNGPRKNLDIVDAVESAIALHSLLKSRIRFKGKDLLAPECSMNGVQPDTGADIEKDVLLFEIIQQGFKKLQFIIKFFHPPLLYGIADFEKKSSGMQLGLGDYHRIGLAAKEKAGPHLAGSFD